MAEKMFGEAMSKLKGKSTRSSPKPVKTDVIEIPKEIYKANPLVDLCIDVMYINKEPILNSIDKTVRFRALVPLDSLQSEEYLKAFDKISRIYNDAGFRIKTFACDKAFEPIFEEVMDNPDLDIKLILVSAQAHVPEAERNNRTIKERFRTAFHRLPYKALPRVMIRTLAMVCTDQLNYFPMKGGVSQYYSPRVIMQLPALDYNAQFQFPFGAYVQAENETKPRNSMKGRIIDGIYLRPDKNNGHEIMSLKSGQVITRPKVTVSPMTSNVINTVK